MFYSVKNLADSSVEQCPEPWNVDVSGINFDVDTAAYKKGNRTAGHEGCLISAVEATLPTQRLSADNPPVAVGAFIADFDGEASEEMIAKILSNTPTEWVPTWRCTTQSGKCRLVWEFEHPVTVLSAEHAQRLLKEVAIKTKARKWGIDYDSASENPGQFFDIGKKWEQLPGAPVPYAVLTLWDRDVTGKYLKKAYRKATDDIPFDVINEEIERRWPGRLTAPLAEGSRCLRFWDPDSDNRSGCTVFPAGVRVYVPHDKPLMTWADIFGVKFVDEYAGGKISPILEHIWYNSSKNTFVRWMPDLNQYLVRNETALKRDLKIEAGLSQKASGAGISEVDLAIHQITSTKDIAYCAPFLFRQHGPLRLTDGRTAINTSMVRVFPPADRSLLSPDGWTDPALYRAFPFIYSFLTVLFMDNQDRADALMGKGELVKPNEQMLYFLAWLAYFYQTSSRLTPSQGQCLVLAGEAGKGKSFLTRYILGPLMGGAADAQSYFITGEKYTGDIVNHPVMMLDDCICQLDPKTRTAFTARLKSLIATGCIRYEEKFRDAVASLPWLGRVVIMCNSDPQSLSVLPDLDLSTKDKITMLKLGTAEFRFGSRDENEKAVARELGAFARFLLEYNIPDDMRDVRFGVRAFQHKDMIAAAADNGYSRAVLDAVYETFLPDVRQCHEKGLPTAGIWEGTARHLLDLIAVTSAMAAKEIGSARNLSANLAILERAEYPIYRVGSRTGAQKWRIARDVAGEYEHVDRETLVRYEPEDEWTAAFRTRVMQKNGRK